MSKKNKQITARFKITYADLQNLVKTLEKEMNNFQAEDSSIVRAESELYIRLTLENGDSEDTYRVEDFSPYATCIEFKGSYYDEIKK